MSRRSLRTSIAITGGRVAGWLSRVTGRGQGATISGRVINAMAPNALAQLAAGQRVALVSATNGKTTTTRLLAAAVARTGEPVVSNATGANLTSGIAPILAKARAPGLAVLEVDERVLPRVVDPLGAELLVLGNLSRDQLDRYGEVHAVGDLWRHAAETHPDLRVVANASDPHVVWAATPAKTTWVDLGLGWRNDAATCPNCAALLSWSTDRFDCPSCGFGQPATPNRLDGDTLVLDGTRVPLRLALPGRWNLANAALAVTAATTHFGVDPHEAADAATTITTVAGRYMTVALPDGRRARVLLAKNPAGWSEVLHHLSDRELLGRDRRERARRGRQGPVVVVGRSLRAAARTAGGRRRRARLRRGGATALRGGRPHRRARPARGRGQAAGRRRQHRGVVHPVLRDLPEVRMSASSESAVRIGLVYPELLGTYGDRGNAVVLVQRLRWRGHAAELVEVTAGAPIPDSLDVYLFGGGEDDPQVMASAGMRSSRAAIDRGRAGGAAVLAVCAGFQLIGHSYEAADGTMIDGLGLVDAVTRAGPNRLIGELVVEPDPPLPVLTGFENHGGRTTLGPSERPLGRVLARNGRGGDTEGLVGERLIGTYMHGPVLPRNPALADHILSWVVGDLSPLDSTTEEQLRATQLDAGSARGVRKWWQERVLARG